MLYKKKLFIIINNVIQEGYFYLKFTYFYIIQIRDWEEQLKLSIKY